MMRTRTLTHWGTCALVVFGSAAYAQQQELYHLSGVTRDSNFGFRIAAMGDVDLDGFEDFAVTASNDSTNGLAAGRATLHSGVDGQVIHEWLGVAESLFGSAVAAAGDVDGDGIGDVIVGAIWEADPAGGVRNGAIHLYSGASGGLLRSLYGASDHEQFGAAVAGLGDVDGDGVGDQVVGAPRADLSKADAGSAFLFSGASGAPLGHVDGIGKNDALGSAIAALGDLDGDGFGDFAVGAPYHDASAIRNSGVVLVHSGATLQRLFFVGGDQPDTELGRAIAGCADLDGDGKNDLLLGVPGWSGALGSEGVVRAFSGVGGVLLWERFGVRQNDRLGGAVAIDDADGDGRPEVLASAAVETSLLRSRVELLAADSGRRKYAWDDPANSDLHGCALALLGDVSGDGHPDVVIGAREGDDGSHTWSGVVYVHPGAGLWLHVDPKFPWVGSTIETTISEGVPGNLALRFVIDIDGAPTFLALPPAVRLDAAGFAAFSELVPPGLSGISATLRVYAVPASGPLAATNDETIAFL